MSSPKPPPRPPGNAPSSRPAPHVQRAVAAVQAKPALQPRNPAPHVQRAVAAVQAKAQPAPAARTLAPHVQAALQKGAPAAVQRATPAETGVRQPAPHVQAALGRNLQAKPQPPGPRPPALHVQTAVQRAASGPVGRQGTQAIAALARGPRAIQRMEEATTSVSSSYKEIISNVRSNLLKDGPGNLNNSSKQARELFNLANHLFQRFRDKMDISSSAFNALARIRLGIHPNNSVEQHRQNSKQSRLDYDTFKENTEKNEELLKLAEVVYLDFILKMTGGGSCDNCSAGVFFQLIEKNPNAKVSIIRYQPQSSETIKIQAPERYPYHRAVLVEQNKESHLVDAWWPYEEGRIDLNTNLSEAEKWVEWDVEKKYPLAKVSEYDYKEDFNKKEFVDALREELFSQYGTLKDTLSKDLGDEVPMWNISEIEKKKN